MLYPRPVPLAASDYGYRKTIDPSPLYASAIGMWQVPPRTLSYACSFRLFYSSAQCFTPDLSPSLPLTTDTEKRLILAPFTPQQLACGRFHPEPFRTLAPSACFTRLHNALPPTCPPRCL